MAIIGNNSEGINYQTGKIYMGTKFTCPASGQISTIYARIGYFFGSSPRPAQVAVYSDNSGAPGIKLSNSDTVLIPLEYLAWYEFLIPTVNLTIGVNYWLMIANIDTASGINFAHDITSGADTKGKVGGDFPGWINNIPIDDIISNSLEIYANINEVIPIQKTINSDAKIKKIGNQQIINSNANIRKREIILSNTKIKVLNNQETILSNARIVKRQTILSNAHITGFVDFPIVTNFVTKLKVNKIIQTLLDTIINRVLSIFNTNLTTKYKSDNIFNTDLRTRIETYDIIVPKKLSDIIVKKDNVELTDVDYSTLKGQFNLNRTPSNVSFILGRHHDDLDHNLAGAVSEITNKNKIQIYDNTKLLFTGYITQIKAISSTDTVEILAEDVRCKINNISLDDLEWGAKYNSVNDSQSDDYDEDSEEWSNKASAEGIISISTKTAIEEVITEIGSLIAGYDPIDFGFIPEYNKLTSDCGSLLDTLINNSGNINWYIDENEYLRFQRVAEGTIKTLPLSGVSVHRHLYDTILNDIAINKLTDNYYTCLDVKLGRKYTRQWMQSTVIPAEYTRDLTWFGFQKWSTGDLHYVGEGIEANYSYATFGFWVAGYFIYQWLFKDKFEDQANITVGTGEPKKTIYLNSYGKKVSNPYWEEITDEITKVASLYEKTEEMYDFTTYATDAANFELSQNNKLLSTATITMVLDAFEYYNITLKDLVNLSNTLIANIYNNANGFPLNIENISIDYSTRIVTLNLTNYGKTAYERTGNYLTSYQRPTKKKLYDRQSIIIISGA
jgi:hypothetical protein